MIRVTLFPSCSRGSLFALVGCAVVRWVSLFPPGSAASLRWCWQQLCSGRSCYTWNHRTGHLLEISDIESQVDARTSCLPSISPGKTDSRTQESRYVCVCLCVCLFIWCYTVITTVWDVDQCSCISWICWDLSGPVPALSHITDRDSLWCNDHLLMIYFFKSAFLKP